MHSNTRFNIIQAESNKPGFAVIEGLRMPGGYPATGAKILSGPALPRDQAIALADALQAATDTHMAELQAAVALPTKEERRAACDAAHLKLQAACDALGVQLPE